jgi:hypothetical protein
MQTKPSKSKNTDEAYGYQVKRHDEADELGFDQYANASDKGKDGHQGQVYVHVSLF